MENKVSLNYFFVLILGLLILGKVYGGDILIHDGGLEKSVIYRVSPDGSQIKEWTIT